MKTLNYVPILLLSLSLSCSEQRKDDSSNVIEITKEVKESFKSYINHVNTKGIKGVDSYFSENNRFYWIEDGVMQYPDRESLLTRN